MNKKLLVVVLCAAALMGCGGKDSEEMKPAASTAEPTASETENAAVSEPSAEASAIAVQKDDATGIRFLSFGRGPKTMVIVPGLTVGYVTDSAAAVADAFAAFTEDYTVYLFDVREDVPENTTIPALGEDLAAVLTRLGLKDICLYGCSMGGMESMYIAGTHPELVEKLVVVSSACAGNDTSARVIGQWITWAEEGRAAELTADMGENIYSEAVYEANKEFFAAMADGLDEATLLRFARTAAAIPGLNLKDTAAGITCPVLVMGSEGDQVLTADASRQIAEITGGELFLYPPETSHAIYDEVPEVRERAKAFFDGE